LNHFHCSLFGHEYKVSKDVTYHVKEYTCKHCKSEYTVNANGKLIPLSEKHREINAVLERIYANKKKRLLKVV